MERKPVTPTAKAPAANFTCDVYVNLAGTVTDEEYRKASAVTGNASIAIAQ